MLSKLYHLTVAAAISAIGFITAHAQEFPEPGIHWRGPEPNSLGEMNYPAGSALNLQASIVDLALISRVVFRARGAEIGSDTTPPYTYTWVADGQGPTTLTAEAWAGTTLVSSASLEVAILQSGLQVLPNPVTMVLPPDQQGSVQVTLTNATSASLNWSGTVWGGTAPHGDGGGVERRIEIPDTARPEARPVLMTRGLHSPSITDDELWWTTSDEDRKKRLDISSGAMLPDFDAPGSNRVHRGSYFLPDEDSFIVLDYALNPTREGIHTYNAASGQRTPLIYDDDYSGRRIATDGALVGYRGASFQTFEDLDNPVFTRLALLRTSDRKLIGDYGPPSLQLNGVRGTVAQSPLTRPSGMTWTMGNVFLFSAARQRVESEFVQYMDRISILRWNPLLSDLEEATNIPGSEIADWEDTPESADNAIAPSATPGHVWVCINHLDRHVLYHVDTGHRQWVRTAGSTHGTLGAGQNGSVDLAFDTNGMQAGAYRADLAIVPTPDAGVPLIRVPVVLTIAEDGTRTISIGVSNQDSVYWDITPSDGTESQDGTSATFDGLRSGTDYTLEATNTSGG